jgi:2-haloacid dehalogenase
MNRRTLLTLAASGPLVQTTAAYAGHSSGIKAIAFDAFAVFDPRPVAARVEELFPGRGAEITAAWRTRQFEYTWLRTLTASYTHFWSVTEDALVYAAKMLKVDLTGQQRQQLMRTFSELRPWPDAPAALKALQDAGIRLVLLSNFTHAMLTSIVSASGLQTRFEPHLSTDKVRAYKPDPRAYRMAVATLKLRRDQIVFAAFAGWDAYGAKAFGYPVYWVNRQDQPAEQLGVTADAMGRTLDDLASWIRRKPEPQL